MVRRPLVCLFGVGLFAIFVTGNQLFTWLCIRRCLVLFRDISSYSTSDVVGGIWHLIVSVPDHVSRFTFHIYFDHFDFLENQT